MPLRERLLIASPVSKGNGSRDNGRDDGVFGRRDRESRVVAGGTQLRIDSVIINQQAGPRIRNPPTVQQDQTLSFVDHNARTSSHPYVKVTRQPRVTQPANSTSPVNINKIYNLRSNSTTVLAHPNISSATVHDSPSAVPQPRIEQDTREVGNAEWRIGTPESGITVTVLPPDGQSQTPSTPKVPKLLASALRIFTPTLPPLSLSDKTLPLKT